LHAAGPSGAAAVGMATARAGLRLRVAPRRAPARVTATARATARAALPRRRPSRLGGPHGLARRRACWQDIHPETVMAGPCPDSVSVAPIS